MNVFDLFYSLSRHNVVEGKLSYARRTIWSVGTLGPWGLEGIGSGNREMWRGCAQAAGGGKGFDKDDAWRRKIVSVMTR
jgi:hypothetical protein